MGRVRILPAGFLCAAALSCLGACTEPTTSAGSNQPLATVGAAPIGLELSSTGVFVDGEGHLLTAGHAATGCSQLYVEKDGRTLMASLVAQSAAHDLALLKVSETLGLPAVFSRDDGVAAHDMVFAASYETLPEVIARGGALSNAVVAADRPRGESGDIALVSEATYGASGAPVLGSTGLVIGMITHRGLEDRVFAASAGDIKAFLVANHVALKEDDQPQLGTLQDRAHRAVTISASVICFKRR